MRGGLRLLPVAAAAALAAMSVAACKDDKPMGVTNVNAEDVPTMMTRNVETLISDSGITRFRITTPLWYVYDEVDDPYWRFPDGLYLEKFDNIFRREATVRCDSARFFKNEQLWRLDGHVDIQNVNKERFLTQQLFWNQRTHKVYSDSFIHIERPDRVVEGYGFESDEQMSRYTIRNVAGIFPASSFTGPGSGGQRSAAPADTAASARDSVAH